MPSGNDLEAITPPPTVLVVDMDGTLLRTDVLHEQLLHILMHAPVHMPQLLWALVRRGRVGFKETLAALSPDFDVSHLPVNDVVLQRVHDAQRAGRVTVLATAGHRAPAEAVARRFGCFDQVLATDRVNLKGAAKLLAIRASLGDQPFEYVGDSRADIPIWHAAAVATVVEPDHATQRRLAQENIPYEVTGHHRNRWPQLIGALRPTHWLKNVLVFLPVFASHRWSDPASVLSALHAFVAFTMVASAVYLANDLADVGADRAHAVKRGRAIAAGRVSISTGAGVSVLLLLGGFFLATQLPERVSSLLLAYVAGNVVYTVVIKRIPVIDVITLAGMYTLRVLVGGAATSIALTNWFLAFFTFLFLSLALLKRFSELLAHSTPDGPGRRGYQHADIDMVRTLGVTSAFASLLVLALYFNSPDVQLLYHRPSALWLVGVTTCWWIARMWLLAGRGIVNEDPIAFAARDRFTWWIALATVLSMLAAV
jgi:4-hydroxybenzoate polyprenyltransferase/phosphoserine phosphatase